MVGTNSSLTTYPKFVSELMAYRLINFPEVTALPKSDKTSCWSGRGMRMLLGGDSSTVAQGLRTLSIHGLGAGNFLGPAVMSGELADTQIAQVRRKRIVKMRGTQGVFLASNLPPVADSIRAALSLGRNSGSGTIYSRTPWLEWTCRRSTGLSRMMQKNCVGIMHGSLYIYIPARRSHGDKGSARTAVGGFIPFIERSAPSIAAPQYSICINRWRLAIVAITSQSEVDVPNIYIYIYIYLYLYLYLNVCIYMYFVFYSYTCDGQLLGIFQVLNWPLCCKRWVML